MFIVLNTLYQERDSLTQKLLKLDGILDYCNEATITHVTLPEDTTSGFMPEGFDMSQQIHLSLGNGNKRRHMHIAMGVSFESLDLEASPSADLLAHSLGSNMVDINRLVSLAMAL